MASTYGDGTYYKVRRKSTINVIAAELAPARDLLDLGCGNGAYLAEFAAFSGRRRLFGADLSFEMLRQAKTQLSARCSLVRADASMLPFDPESFDLIFASHVLPFVRDLGATVREIARCLSPGGALIATRQGDGGVRRELAELVGAERWEQIAPAIFRRATRAALSAPDDEPYRAAFVAAGLSFEERAAPFTIDWADVVEWIHIRWNPVIPETERAGVERMLAEIGQLAAGRSFALHEPIAIGRKAA